MSRTNSPAGDPGFALDGRYDVTGDDRPGATVVDGGVRFEVWAPVATRVDVVIHRTAGDDVHVLEGPTPAGTFSAVVPGIGHGTRYRFRLDGGEPLADPASRWQPDGVFGPSAVVDVAEFDWTDHEWRGVELADSVVYELHVGTFTPEGTLDSAIAQLPRLAGLGITTVELMPLAQFSGERGWGYDGVFLSAVQHSYGGPEALARFVDAAHGLGLAVLVDAVYNHFGPEGSVVEHYGPYLSAHHSTVWGAAVNFAEAGSDQVRRLCLDTARTWVDDFHVDGLRVDAADAIVDDTSHPFLEELVTAVHEIGDIRGRTVLTFFETSANDPRTVTPAPLGIGSDAQWLDEFHHAVRVAVTGDRRGYYVDYVGPSDLAEIVAHRFTYRGRYSEHRDRRHGRDASHLAPHHFLVCDQNHDQVGNRPDGARLDTLVDLERRKTALAAVLLSPYVPMLWMGEEYGETNPFPFFADHQGEELRDRVRVGRAEEFAVFDWPGHPLDPFDEETFRSATLDPAKSSAAPHSHVLALTAALLRCRREHTPLAHPDADLHVDVDGPTVAWTRTLGDDLTRVVVHLSDGHAAFPADGLAPVLDTAAVDFGGPGSSGAQDQVVLAPWSVVLLAP